MAVGCCAARFGSTPKSATMQLTTSLMGPLTTADRAEHLGTNAAKHKDATIAGPYVPKPVLRVRNDLDGGRATHADWLWTGLLAGDLAAWYFRVAFANGRCSNNRSTSARETR